ncbi:MAG: wax ester/triacylglycerol synthase family O-acyltransferase [Solirubrobacterales bacterium]|nr:wax ester/triacylglycerol synthase family O-acyltransferase [Solirubrobacterales bacterium]
MSPIPERARPLTAFDAQFLAAEAGNMTSNYCGLGVYGPDASGAALTRERVRDLVAARIDRIPALRWHLQSTPLGVDHPSFVDGPVDLDDHVLAATLPAPGGPIQLAELTAQMMATKLDRRRPLWRFVVVDGLADGRVAVAMVFHHAAADALAFATILSLLLDVQPDPADRTDLPAMVPPLPGPDARTRALQIARRTATHPLRATRAGAAALPYLDQVPMMRALPGAQTIARAARRVQGVTGPAKDHGEYLQAPKVRFNGPLSPGRSIAYGHVDLAVVKALKEAAGITFNDVVVAAVGGGLRRRLAATDGVPETPLLAFVPSSVRTTDDRGRIGNAISSYVVPVPTHLEDPTARVAAAARGMTAAKTRQADAPTTLLEDANELISPIVFAPLAGGMLRLMGTGLFAPPLNLVLSNVPGPPVTLHLDGAPMEEVAPLSLVFDGVALNITVVSYAGRLEIGVVGDRELVPDAWDLVADIQAEFAALLDLLPEPVVRQSSPAGA